jgi:uncharacterized protein YndB with AHSA1/START domain
VSSITVRVTRVLPADIHRVFDAWSSAEAMSKWWVVEPSWKAKVASDFRVGGKYRVEMHRDDGTVFVAWGEYLAIEPPRRLVFTWHSAAPAIQNSKVTIELTRVGASTELTVIHELLPDTPEGRAHAIGWEGTLAVLANHLAARAGTDGGKRP